MKFRMLIFISCLAIMIGLVTGPVTGGTPPTRLSGAPSLPAAPAAGISPSILSIPRVTAQGAPTLDGICSGNEYKNGVTLPFVDGPTGGNGSVHILHDGTNLYVCLSGFVGSNPDRFSSLYLDPQADGVTYTFAQSDDYSLRVDLKGSLNISLQGSGVGQNPASYIADSSIDPFWSGLASSGNADQFEYQVSLADFKLDRCNLFSMALYHHWFSSTGDDYGWPTDQWFDQPRTWQLAKLESYTCGKATGKIAYVFRGNTLDAISYYNLLSAAGYSVTLVPLGAVLSTDFTTFDLTLIADDTGYLDEWGTTAPALTTAQVNQITATNPAGKPNGTPILGLGEGGYAFFGRLSMQIGWPRGWHGPQDSLRRAPGAPASFYTSVATPDPIPLYATPANSVGIYLLPAPLPPDVLTIGLEEPLDNHASLIMQNCRMLWGNGSPPSNMTFDGQTIFLNSVAYVSTFQCPPPPSVISPECQVVSKSASPAAPGPVAPGSAITYTLTRTISSGTCPAGKLVDTIPLGTTYLPNSATDGILPDAAGTLTWPLETTPGTQTLKFTAVVSDVACSMANKQVSNFAELRLSGSAPIPSNTVTHTVTCPPVGFPNTQPMFAETELKLDPYPLTAGVPSKVSVRVANLSVPAAAQTVTVQFKTATPAQLGIGLNYATLVASTTGVVPAGGSAVFSATFVPTTTGNACVQAIVTAAGAQPLLTESCLDVTESLTPGSTDTLSIPIRNNTTTDFATVALVVDNTCPGWTAVISTPAAGQFTNMGIGETRTATLSVTPPTGALLGTHCHIDVQAWVGTQLIGGIRKIDVAPVHLPLDVQPPWEEPEISFVPYPPQAGVPGQICIQLVNPLAVSRQVSVDFSVADFGAGVGFAPAASIVNVTLPPLSVTTQCANWTPLASGTLHRCVMATLKQAGYLDQTSQRNIDISRPTPSDSTSLIRNFVVGNPHLTEHMVSFQLNPVGLPPAWSVVIEMAGGGPVPNTPLAAGGRLAMQLRLVPPAGILNPNAAPAPLIDFRYGSQHSVEVTVLLDNDPVGGFSVQFEPRSIFIPTIRR